jgi:hypothetical protein
LVVVETWTNARSKKIAKLVLEPCKIMEAAPVIEDLIKDPSLTPIQVPLHMEHATWEPPSVGKIRPSKIHAVSGDSQESNLLAGRGIG